MANDTTTRFLATVYEASYKDDWNDGEVDSTYQRFQITQKTYDSAEEAVKDFVRQFGGGDWSAPETIDDGLIGISAIKADDEYGWRTPTKEQEEAWKQGKFELWNVERQLKLQKLETLTNEELDSVLANCKKEN